VDVIQSKTYSRLLAAIGAALTALVLVAPAANAATPAPGYEQFAGCPSPEEHPAVPVCVRTVIDGGHFQMGSKDVPIVNPVTLSGGLSATGTVANSKGGMTPVKQPVPGGIIGLTGLDWLVDFLDIEELKLYAVTELAGQPGIPLEEDPLKLPIRVHLINPVLGNSCYVGSFASPIQLKLTLGPTSPPPPNESIKGKVPSFEFDESSRILSVFDGTFVDNSFAAPGANGCKLVLFGFLPISINGLVNSQSGLPSAAGTNETVQHFDGEFVERSVVYP
jgi:hypothetical protein